MHSNNNQTLGAPRYLHSVFFASFSFVFINFSLPIRADDLGIDAVGIGAMYAVFTSTILIIRPAIGYCLDRFGRRRFFSSAFFFYVIAMMVFTQSTSLADFYLARFLQGIGASLMWVSARTITTDLYVTSSVGFGMGKLTTTSVRGSMLGATYGFTLLGFFPLQTAWVWAFSGYACAAAIALVISFLVPQKDRPLTANATNQARRQALPWSPPLRKILFIVFLTAFASALLEPIYLLYLKNKFDISVLALALVFLPAGLVHAILPRYAGQWSDRWGRSGVIAAGVTIAGCVSIALPYWHSLYFIALCYVLFACGWAMASPAQEALVADFCPPHLRGTTMGAKEAASGLGNALGPLAGGYIYEHWANDMAFVSNGTLLLMCAALALLWFNKNTTR